MALRADDVDVDRDRALVRRFQAGDDGAFDELYRRYHDRLERFCRKRVRDQHTAEELAQEAFTRALTALPDLSGDMRFYPWVSVIAARLCVDSHRRLARSEPMSNPDPGSVAGGQEDIVEAVDASLVVAALARLAPRHQDVLHLREIEGWSYQRIASHYNVTIGTVETLLFRARRALRREFRLIDGAGMAAVPLLGRFVGLAVRARNRMPRWIPSIPAPATVAVAASAAAAAVALAVVPGRGSLRSAAPLPPPATAPAQGVGRQVPPPPTASGAAAHGPRVTATTGLPQASGADAAASANSAASALPGPGDGAAAARTDPGASTTTTTATPTATAELGAPSPLAVVPPLTLPSTDTFTSVVPPVSLPTVASLPAPTVGLGTTSAPAVGDAQGTVGDLVNNLLPGH